jgi:hypothetical protein
MEPYISDSPNATRKSSEKLIPRLFLVGIVRMRSSLLILCSAVLLLCVAVNGLDCSVSDWTDFGKCDMVSRLESRTRQLGTQSIVKDGSTGSCKIETDTRPCLIDCSLSDWVNSGGCSGGFQSQIKNVVSEPMGGNGCPRPLPTQQITC